MRTEVATGILLISLPIAYNLLFTVLARSFDYPDILRRPTGEVLQRFAAGGSKLLLTWWAFAMSAVLLAPTGVLVSATFTDANPTLLSLATALGLLAALVQFIGLIRWPFDVPHLAREMSDPTSTASTKDVVDVTFQTLNRYLGVAVGEHLGYMFTGFWDSTRGSDRPAIGDSASGVRDSQPDPGPVFPGRFDGVRRKQREGRLEVRGDVPMVCIGWSLWLLALGILLLVGK